MKSSIKSVLVDALLRMPLWIALPLGEVIRTAWRGFSNA